MLKEDEEDENRKKLVGCNWMLYNDAGMCIYDVGDRVMCVLKGCRKKGD